MGKTLCRSLARGARAASSARIQFTPDLLPRDVIGTPLFDQRTGSSRSGPGRSSANLVLADEINRTPPKTQSALLEAMEERQVTRRRVTYAAAAAVLVLATQNPIEYEGTYPLPEAQLDRFLLRLRLGYPAARGRDRHAAPAESASRRGRRRRARPVTDAA